MPPVRRVRLLLVSGVLACIALPACAGEYVAPVCDRPPTLDGRFDPEEWRDAVSLDGFGWEGLLEQRRASGAVLLTETHLYLAIRSRLPDRGTLLAACERDSENLVFDDSVEVWIDPTPGAESGARLQMLANPLGRRWFRRHPYGGAPEDASWRGAWEVANGIAQGEWCCEVAIALSELCPGRAADGLALAINLCRNWKQEWAFSSLGQGEYRPSDVFRFRRGAPAVALEQRDDPFDGRVCSVLVLRNPAATALPVRASLRLERDLMPPLAEELLLDLAPGESREVALAVEDHSTNRHTLAARVTSPDGQTVYLDRVSAWKRLGPLTWVTEERAIPPVDFQFAYYPYRNRLRVLADVSNLPKDATLETLRGVVRTQGGAVVRELAFDALVNGRQEIVTDLPRLEGPYEIALRATGPGVPDREVVKGFERTRFPWEHNDLGRSTTVYPPFTPIEVAGKRVSTVLRSHEMADDGLWAQANARGEDLLAGPMRWETPEGPAAGGPLRFTRTEGHETVAETTIERGALRGTVRSTWDYDGTMRVDVTLAPSEGRTVDGLDLAIPLREDQATHYHAMGDGIRNTLYARLPEGEGTVWTSQAVQANDLPEGFCTYLYLGTPTRGLCWFAENDRGWGWDPATPNVEIVRAPGRAEIRVHLVNRPTVVDAPRTITFGLLAAPVKPRIPDDWRHRWRRDNYSLLGTDINWLALGDCGSVYPAGRDLYLWEMIARGNREHLSDEEIARVVERIRPWFEPYGAERVQTAEAHARHNLTGRYGTRMVYYYNRASYQAAEEFETFKDEWALTDWRSVERGDGIWEIKIVPSESYIDHAVYWYAKSFEIGGNQGVYWDNWFLVGDYNTEMTSAYRRPDGAVVPSTGLWGLRALAKRTFQMMNERGMPPITMPHMTSTAILPLLSFATVQYDWEWKYSEGDAQDRFSRDYILMVSNGDLAGVWPVLLNDHGPQADDPWIARTFAACALVHELDCPYPGWSETGKAQLALCAPIDELLGDPRLRVWRYWDDEPPPIRAADPDLPTIVYALPGDRAVAAVVSYAPEERAVDLTIEPAALGFGAGYRVIDAETGEELAVDGDHVRFRLGKHDVRLVRVVSR